jgi:hypothetical protein
LDFLNHWEGGTVFYQVFLFSPLQCTVTDSRNCERLRELEEIEISRQDCEQQGENSEDFCLHFVQEFGLWSQRVSPPPPVWKEESKAKVSRTKKEP